MTWWNVEMVNNQGELDRLRAQRRQLREALENLMSDIGGGEKQCGHGFDCICARDTARAALKETED